MSKSIKKFQSLQYAFSSHLRDPENVPAPEGIEDRRLKVYRDLFFSNMRSLVSNTFPVLKKFYSDEQWDNLIREFMVQHESHTPLFLEISSEFIQFLQNTYQAKEIDPPFMLELAHYEWVELAVSIMQEEPELEKIDSHGDLLNNAPYLTSAFSSLAYEYPVHTIKPGYDDTQKPEQASYMLVYRKLDDSVEFMQLNAVSARLIELMSERSTKTGLQLLEQIATELQHPQPQVVIDGGKGLLQQFRDKEVILGTYINL